MRLLPIVPVLLFLVGAISAPAHDAPVARDEVTYSIAKPWTPADKPRLLVNIVDDESGEPIAARFVLSLKSEGGKLVEHIPDAIDQNGIRFTSIHTSKKQEATVLYSRGTGPVALPLPPHSRVGEVSVVKGYEYRVTRQIFERDPSDSETSVTVRLVRWSDAADRGWLAADEHLHYERSDPAHDVDWLTMMDADGLAHGFFMVLNGGNVPGIWAQQYAYGKEGEAGDGKRLLVTGEEFRGPLQGHNNLLGLGSVIEPISIGRGEKGAPAEAFNWPSTHDVLVQARESGGIGGPAHGGAFGKASTAILDAVLGASEFFELANTHLYVLDPWYPLLNCGFILPPVAGTDLPNFPFRDKWQPLFGETRTYVQPESPGASNFEAWKNALRKGRSFITSGPMIRLEVDANTVPVAGGTIRVEAVLESPLPLSKFELIRSGIPLDLPIERVEAEDGVNRWTISGDIRITGSCWIAARGEGLRKDAVWAESSMLQRASAHTAAVPVLAGGKPIRSPEDAASLIKRLEEQRAVYADEKQARYPDPADRARMLERFDRAIAKLK